MSQSFNWKSTPVDREKKLRDGDWVDLTQAFLGHRAKVGAIHICCSRKFYTTVMESSTSNESKIKELRHFLKQCDFEFKFRREVFKGKCYQTTEEFRNQRTICYTFFLGE